MRGLARTKPIPTATVTDIAPTAIAVPSQMRPVDQLHHLDELILVITAVPPFRVDLEAGDPVAALPCHLRVVRHPGLWGTS
jgi:hypothetical protein